jgi:hypothetical protein
MPSPRMPDRASSTKSIYRCPISSVTTRDRHRSALKVQGARFT